MLKYFIIKITIANFAQNFANLAVKPIHFTMKQMIKVPFSEKLNFILILLFYFGMPFFLLITFGFDYKNKILWFILINLFLLGIYSLYKIFQNFKSVFISCTLSREEKLLIINSFAEDKYFKILANFDNTIIKIHYQKYILGLDYEIHFYLDEQHIEFNAFCKRQGIIDFGIRKKLIQHLKSKIEIRCKNNTILL